MERGSRPRRDAGWHRQPPRRRPVDFVCCSACPSRACGVQRGGSTSRTPLPLLVRMCGSSAWFVCGLPEALPLRPAPRRGQPARRAQALVHSLRNVGAAHSKPWGQAPRGPWGSGPRVRFHSVSRDMPGVRLVLPRCPCPSAAPLSRHWHTGYGSVCASVALLKALAGRSALARNKGLARCWPFAAARSATPALTPAPSDPPPRRRKTTTLEEKRRKQGEVFLKVSGGTGPAAAAASVRSAF